MDLREFTVLDEVGAEDPQVRTVETNFKPSTAAEEIDYLNKILADIEKNNGSDINSNRKNSGGSESIEGCNFESNNSSECKLLSDTSKEDPGSGNCGQNSFENEDNEGHKPLNYHASAEKQFEGYNDFEKQTSESANENEHHFEVQQCILQGFDLSHADNIVTQAHDQHISTSNTDSGLVQSGLSTEPNLVNVELVNKSYSNSSQNINAKDTNQDAELEDLVCNVGPISLASLNEAGSSELRPNTTDATTLAIDSPGHNSPLLESQCYSAGDISNTGSYLSGEDVSGLTYENAESLGNKLKSNSTIPGNPSSLLENLQEPAAVIQGIESNLLETHIDLSLVKSEPIDTDPGGEFECVGFIDDPAEDFRVKEEPKIKEEPPEYSPPVVDQAVNLFSVKVFKSEDESPGEPSVVRNIRYRVEDDKYYSREQVTAALIISQSSLAPAIDMDMFHNVGRTSLMLKLISLEDLIHNPCQIGLEDVDIVKLFVKNYGSSFFQWKKFFNYKAKNSKKCPASGVKSSKKDSGRKKKTRENEALAKTSRLHEDNSSEKEEKYIEASSNEEKCIESLPNEEGKKKKRKKKKHKNHKQLDREITEDEDLVNKKSGDMSKAIHQEEDNNSTDSDKVPDNHKLSNEEITKTKLVVNQNMDDIPKVIHQDDDNSANSDLPGSHKLLNTEIKKTEFLVNQNLNSISKVIDQDDNSVDANKVPGNHKLLNSELVKNEQLGSQSSDDDISTVVHQDDNSTDSDKEPDCNEREKRELNNAEKEHEQSNPSQCESLNNKVNLVKGEYKCHMNTMAPEEDRFKVLGGVILDNRCKACSVNLVDIAKDKKYKNIVQKYLRLLDKKKVLLPLDQEKVEDKPADCKSLKLDTSAEADEGLNIQPASKFTELKKPDKRTLENTHENSSGSVENDDESKHARQEEADHHKETALYDEDCCNISGHKSYKPESATEETNVISKSEQKEDLSKNANTLLVPESSESEKVEEVETSLAANEKSEKINGSKDKDECKQLKLINMETNRGKDTIELTREDKDKLKRREKKKSKHEERIPEVKSMRKELENTAKFKREKKPKVTEKDHHHAKWKQEKMKERDKKFKELEQRRKFAVHHGSKKEETGENDSVSKENATITCNSLPSITTFKIPKKKAVDTRGPAVEKQNLVLSRRKEMLASGSPSGYYSSKTFDHDKNRRVGREWNSQTKVDNRNLDQNTVENKLQSKQQINEGWARKEMPNFSGRDISRANDSFGYALQRQQVAPQMERERIVPHISSPPVLEKQSMIPCNSTFEVEGRDVNTGKSLGSEYPSLPFHPIKMVETEMSSNAPPPPIVDNWSMIPIKNTCETTDDHSYFSGGFSPADSIDSPRELRCGTKDSEREENSIRGNALSKSENLSSSIVATKSSIADSDNSGKESDDYANMVSKLVGSQMHDIKLMEKAKDDVKIMEKVKVKDDIRTVEDVKVKADVKTVEEVKVTTDVKTVEEVKVKADVKTVCSVAERCSHLDMKQKMRVYEKMKRCYYDAKKKYHDEKGEKKKIRYIEYERRKKEYYDLKIYLCEEKKREYVEKKKAQKENMSKQRNVHENSKPEVESTKQKLEPEVESTKQKLEPEPSSATDKPQDNLNECPDDNENSEDGADNDPYSPTGSPILLDPDFSAINVRASLLDVNLPFGKSLSYFEQIKEKIVNATPSYEADKAMNTPASKTSESPSRTKATLPADGLSAVATPVLTSPKPPNRKPDQSPIQGSSVAVPPHLPSLFSSPLAHNSVPLPVPPPQPISSNNSGNSFRITSSLPVPLPVKASLILPVPPPSCTAAPSFVSLAASSGGIVKEPVACPATISELAAQSNQTLSSSLKKTEPLEIPLVSPTIKNQSQMLVDLAPPPLPPDSLFALMGYNPTTVDRTKDRQDSSLDDIIEIPMDIDSESDASAVEENDAEFLASFGICVASPTFKEQVTSRDDTSSKTDTNFKNVLTRLMETKKKELGISTTKNQDDHEQKQEPNAGVGNISGNNLGNLGTAGSDDVAETSDPSNHIELSEESADVNGFKEKTTKEPPKKLFCVDELLMSVETADQQSDLEVVFSNIQKDYSSVKVFRDEVPKYYQKTPLAQTLVDKCKDIPLVGLQYVLEVRQDVDMTLDGCYYICVLCSKKMNTHTLIPHIKSVHHKLRFSEIHCVDIYAKYGSYVIKEWTAARVKEFTVALAEVEAKLGRHKLAVAFEKDLSSVLAALKNKITEIKKLSKPKDQDVEEIRKDSLNQDSSTTIPLQSITKVSTSQMDIPLPSATLSQKTACISANESNKASGSYNNSGVGAFVGHGFRKRNYRPGPNSSQRSSSPSPTNSPSPKRISPKRRNNSRSPSPKRRRESSSPSTKKIKQSRYSPSRDDSTQFYSGSRKRRQSRSPTSSNRRSGSRSRGVHGRHRSRSRSRSKHRSRSRSRSRHRSPYRRNDRRTQHSPQRKRDSKGWNKHSMENNLKEFRESEVRLRARHINRQVGYEKHPEDHPDYNHEWRIFWERRCAELEASGINAFSHDFKSEWALFWRQRIKEIMASEYKSKRDSLLRKYNLEDPDLPVSAKQNYETGKTGRKADPSWSSTAREDTVSRIDRSPSPWEDDGRTKKSDKNPSPPREVIKEKTQSPTTYEEEFSVIGTLKLLNELEDQLGSFGPAIITLLDKAVEHSQKGGNAMDLFNDPDNLVLVRYAREKLSSQVSARILGVSALVRTQMAVERAMWLQSEAEKLSNKEKYLGLDIANIARATLGKDKIQVAQYIAQHLLQVGNSNVSEQDLQNILVAVSASHKQIAVEQAENEAQNKTSDDSENAVEPVHTSVSNSPSKENSKNAFNTLDAKQSQKSLFPSAASNNNTRSSRRSRSPPSKSLGLSMLQSAYEDENAKDMEKLSLEDLRSLLANFRSLSPEEQQALTTYLKKLEATDSKKVMKLREEMQKSAKNAAKKVIPKSNPANSQTKPVEFSEGSTVIKDIRHPITNTPASRPPAEAFTPQQIKLDMQNKPEMFQPSGITMHRGNSIPTDIFNPPAEAEVQKLNTYQERKKSPLSISEALKEFESQNSFEVLDAQNRMSFSNNSQLEYSGPPRPSIPREGSSYTLGSDFPRQNFTESVDKDHYRSDYNRPFGQGGPLGHNTSEGPPIFNNPGSSQGVQNYKPVYDRGYPSRGDTFSNNSNERNENNWYDERSHPPPFAPPEPFQSREFGNSLRGRPPPFGGPPGTQLPFQQQW
nr:uncharacterized protein LOC123762906 isoform X2 [Procambarus clarkii]